MIHNDYPNLHLNLKSIKKAYHKNKNEINSSSLYNNTSKVSSKNSKEKLSNCITIYTSNMNNIKTKELNLKQFVNNNKIKKSNK